MTTSLRRAAAVAALIGAAVSLGACAARTGVEGDAASDPLSAAAKRGMAATGARGLAIAAIRAGDVERVEAFGDRNAAGDPLSANTIMYAASITKAAFAYYVLMLVDDGLIDLDTSIADYLPRPLPEYGDAEKSYAPYEDLAGDDRWRRLTPRMLLAHGSGFKNYYFLPPGRDLKFMIEPGARYAYSGDGYILLQFVLEKGLGVDVRAGMQARIFDPLGMARSDMMWRDDFAENLADGWTASGDPVPHDDRSKTRAAGSLDSTISDVARLAAALVRCEGLSEAACEEHFRPSMPIVTASQFPTLQEPLPEDARRKDLAGALGVVVFEGPQGPAFFKGGHNESTGNTMVCVRRSRDCVVILSNDVRAEAAFPMIVREALGETGAPWRWEYSRLRFVE